MSPSDHDSDFVKALPDDDGEEVPAVPVESTADAGESNGLADLPMAELVTGQGRGDARRLVDPGGLSRPSPSAVPFDFDPENDPETRLRRQTAVAGAVASVFLGSWSLLFSWLTSLAVINALLGMNFGLWGLRSTRPYLSVAGIVLSVAGFMATLWFSSNR